MNAIPLADVSLCPLQIRHLKSPRSCKIKDTWKKVTRLWDQEDYWYGHVSGTGIIR